MNILIFIGPTNNGFDTPAGSEQRYLMNLAEMFALNGHTVSCAGSDASGSSPPKWGGCEPVRGIRLCHLSQVLKSDTVYDFAIVSENFVHWRSGCIDVQTPCTDFNRKAKVIGHTLFGWAGKGLPCCEHSFQKHHWVIQPFEPHVMRENDAVIYYPILKDKPAENLENRKSLVIACKGLFTDEWPEDRNFHTAGVKIMRVIKRLSEECGVKPIFFNSRLDSSRSKRLGVYDIVNSIPDKEIHDSLVNSSVLENAFDNSRINIIMHGYFSSAFLAPARGAVPVYFKDDNGNVWHPFNRLLDASADDQEAFEVLKRFFVDDEYYLTRLSYSLDLISKFSYNSSHESFLRFMDVCK